MEKKLLEIIRLSYSHSQSGAYALILGEVGGKRRIPIIIGGYEAQAIALGIEAVRAGFRVQFANASALIERLAKADREKRLEEMIRELSRFQLIIIDEMGYLPFDDFGAHCFFQLVSRRYERASIIFTSNKSYGEWGDIFKDHVIAAAILDRILHHCTTVNIKGDSYRLKDRKRQGIIPQSFSG